MTAPLVLLNAVGLTPRLLPHAPRLSRLLAEGNGWLRRLREVVPAVTCTAQASMLTGEGPAAHGIVGNGWLFRDTMEVRFWQQSNRLIQREPLYATARQRATARGRTFRCAKLFWWFNQGADVDLSVTPKPYYGSDGNKAFGITGTPDGLTTRLEAELGAFPFPSFWGPMAGPACTQWIARCAASILRQDRPDLSLVYLPHLDYDPQRHGPAGCDMARLTAQLDDACVPLLDAAKAVGARVWVVSEYGHVKVTQAVEPNRALRRPVGGDLDQPVPDALSHRCALENRHRGTAFGSDPRSLVGRSRGDVDRPLPPEPDRLDLLRHVKTGPREVEAVGQPHAVADEFQRPERPKPLARLCRGPHRAVVIEQDDRGSSLRDRPKYCPFGVPLPEPTRLRPRQETAAPGPEPRQAVGVEQQGRLILEPDGQAARGVWGLRQAGEEDHVTDDQGAVPRTAEDFPRPTRGDGVEGVAAEQPPDRAELVAKRPRDALHRLQELRHRRAGDDPLRVGDPAEEVPLGHPPVGQREVGPERLRLPTGGNPARQDVTRDAPEPALADQPCRGLARLRI